MELLMYKKILPLLTFVISTMASATPITWELMNFEFSDGGTAYGSFTYDSVIDQFSDIDIYTTAGSDLDGRHFIATAGAWGDNPENGTLAFSDSVGPNFTGAGWFRISANIDFEAAPGTVVDQWLAVGAESFCTNYVCNSAANEITSPGQSRDTISGYLVATATSVPEPPVSLLLGLGLIAFVSTRNKRSGH
jgi:hypothetical protein